MRGLVRLKAYRAQLEDPDVPTLANSFLCAALILAYYEVGLAGRLAIRAAWACDDAEDSGEHAATVRGRSSSSASRRPRPTLSTPTRDWEAAMLADVLRRSGRFEEAVALSDETLEYAEGDVRLVRGFARELAVAHDSRCYTFADAPRVGCAATSRRACSARGAAALLLGSA